MKILGTAGKEDEYIVSVNQSEMYALLGKAKGYGDKLDLKPGDTVHVSEIYQRLQAMSQERGTLVQLNNAIVKAVELIDKPEVSITRFIETKLGIPLEHDLKKVEK